MFRLTLFLTLLSTNLLFANASPSNRALGEAESAIRQLIEKISLESNHSEKNNLNDELISVFYEALLIEGSFNYPFESIKNVGNLRSTDNTIRIFTWNIPQTGGLQRYFGFIQVNLIDNVVVYPLTDNRKSFKTPQLEESDPNNWYGSLYYSLKEVVHQGKTFYTLLGVDLNNIFSTKRVIEILYLNEKKEPVFGYPIFRIQKNLINRVIFEYSARANMALRWADDLNMIVFDHLTPLRPDYRDNFQFYVPDLSFDGFKFEDSYWVYVPDVDIKNESRTRPPRPKAPEESIDPGFIYRPR